MAVYVHEITPVVSDDSESELGVGPETSPKLAVPVTVGTDGAIELWVAVEWFVIVKVSVTDFCVPSALGEADSWASKATRFQVGVPV